MIDAIANVLERGFINEHYAVDVAKDGHLGWQLVKAYDYDLIVLDVMLPKLDGIEFCQRLRDSAYQMPVLMVTALRFQHAQNCRAKCRGRRLHHQTLRARRAVDSGAGAVAASPDPPCCKSWSGGDLQLDPNTREVAYGSQTLRPDSERISSAGAISAQAIPGLQPRGYFRQPVELRRSPPAKIPRNSPH